MTRRFFLEILFSRLRDQPGAVSFTRRSFLKFEYLGEIEYIFFCLAGDQKSLNHEKKSVRKSKSYTPFKPTMSQSLSLNFCLPQVEVALFAPRFYSINSDSACPQSFPTVRDVGFEPGTTATVVWSTTNEQHHLRYLNLP